MSNSSRIRSFVRANRQAITFFVLFVSIFLVLQRLYVASRERSANLLTHKLNAVVASGIINRITPAERTRVEGSFIASGGVGVDIKKGCEGFEVILLLLSAILAFPRKWLHKFLGILAGMVLIYVVNLVRIVSLFYVFKYRRELFEFMHLSVWQTIFIIMVAAYFVLWATVTSGAHRAKSS